MSDDDESGSGSEYSDDSRNTAQLAADARADWIEYVLLLLLLLKHPAMLHC